MTLAGYSITAGRALSPRMRDVVAAAARGASIGQTATELGVAEGTVRTIRAAALARLGVHSIAAAVGEAYRRGEL
jgi:two-component system nitrate/nitrite response regulator NarL